LISTEQIILYAAIPAALSVALVTTKVVSIWVSPDNSKNRFLTIDGLRGYLAFFVLLHHAGFWRSYSSTGIWLPPRSHLYVLFGAVSVKLFFMITGFLFFSKLLNRREGYFDFLSLVVSRLLRLMPLYVFVIFVMFIVILAKTGWVIHVSLVDLLGTTFSWVLFTLPGSPDWNGFHPTSVVMSGVYWTLPYEWMFYISLPIFAVMLRVKSSLGVLLFSASFLLLLATPDVNFLPFLGGIVAAFAVRKTELCRWAETRAASFMAAVLLVVHGVSDRLWGNFSLFPLAAAFVLFACGNNLFGVLSARLSRLLGEYTYGIYLTHGIILFVMFNFLVGADFSKSMSPLQYWCVIVAAVPIFIVIAAISFYFIEAPAMARATAITALFRGAERRLLSP
jgi:peptidoglycan/LPS O-acetylase OafA/YrhL